MPVAMRWTEESLLVMDVARFVYTHFYALLNQAEVVTVISTFLFPNIVLFKLNTLIPLSLPSKKLAYVV